MKENGKEIGQQNQKRRINFGEIPGSIVSNKMSPVKKGAETTLTNPERKIWAERMSI